MSNVEGVYRCWPYGKDVPEGWEYAAECAGHHAYWSYLIKRKKS